MIRKTIIAAVIFFIIYNVILIWLRPFAGPGQNQWQKNRIAVEEYVDKYQGMKVVIVGTSLSGRLYPSLLPVGYYNLAMAGESSFDGLEIVKRCAKKPKYLLIESNFFYDKTDKELSEGVFNPLMMRLRKWAPSFREENQPANLLIPFLKIGSKANANTPDNMDSSIQSKLLRQRIADYQQVPDSKDVTNGIERLKNDISELQSEGVKVILFEIPIHCKLYNTPKYLIPEKKLKDAFPADKYMWMPMPDCNAYQYADGEHISFQSSIKFADWFVGELHKLGVKP